MNANQLKLFLLQVSAKKLINQIPALRFLSEPLRVQKEDMLIEYHTGEILSAMDQKVFMGLQALWKTKGEGQRVLFTYYELAHLIGFPTKGSGYRLIDEALNSLFNTRIFLASNRTD